MRSCLYRKWRQLAEVPAKKEMQLERNDDDDAAGADVEVAVLANFVMAVVAPDSVLVADRGRRTG